MMYQKNKPTLKRYQTTKLRITPHHLFLVGSAVAVWAVILFFAFNIGSQKEVKANETIEAMKVRNTTGSGSTTVNYSYSYGDPESVTDVVRKNECGRRGNRLEVITKRVY
jgi:hypothetical protein